MEDWYDDVRNVAITKTKAGVKPRPLKQEDKNMKKYFKTKAQANKAKKERANDALHVFRMPKGSRHAGQFAVCTEIEYLNTY